MTSIAEKIGLALDLLENTVGLQGGPAATRLRAAAMQLLREARHQALSTPAPTDQFTRSTQ